ncbi:MAG: AzlD domain-containing protein [Microbispora sp.]|nr:AzlD domain-containing protein [Microbispora sp.]
MPLVAILALAAGTYAFRLAGPVLRHRLHLPTRLRHLLSVAATVLLIALAATSALTEGQGFAGWARPAGVLVAAILTLRKAPFPLIVVLAAATTAVLRLLGVP